MKMIWAVVRSSKVGDITRQLKEIGASGCTVYPVRGYGECRNEFDWSTLEYLSTCTGRDEAGLMVMISWCMIGGLIESI